MGFGSEFKMRQERKNVLGDYSLKKAVLGTFLYLKLKNSIINQSIKWPCGN